MKKIPFSRASAFAAALLAAALAAPARAQLMPPIVSSGSIIGLSSITWTWSQNGATVPDGYRVLSSTGGGNISGDLPNTAGSFALTGLSTNTATTVTIEAFKALSANQDALSTLATAAAGPTGTMLLGTNVTAVTLSWLANGNPAGTVYAVDWSTGPGAVVVFTTAAVAGSSVSATVADLPGGMTISFEVMAQNSAGVQTGFDAPVSTTLPALYGQPVLSSATFAGGISSITWFWSASTGAFAYQLFNATNGAVSPLLPGSAVSYLEKGLLTNTSYQNYVTAYSLASSTNSAPFTRYTLASPTTALMLLQLSSASLAGVNSETALLSWGADGDPAGTYYNALWWANIGSTATVAVSTPATSVQLGNLNGGSTLYFTVQAVNGDGIAAAFDSTFFGVIPSTYFTTGIQILPTGFAGALSYTLPSSVVTLTFSSGTFSVPVTVTISTASGAVPPPSPGQTVLPDPPGSTNSFAMQIFAYDAFGNPQQPLAPITVQSLYAPGALGNLPANAVDIARFDATRGLWIPLTTLRNANSLLAVTDHLSLFSVFSVLPPSDLSSISVGPNPLRPTLVPGEVMTFRGLPAGARVRIFTYVGEKLTDVTADGSGVVSWDGRNAAGNEVASGVYIAVIEGSGSKKLMRVAVER